MVMINSVGSNPTRIWRMTNHERTRRVFASLPPVAEEGSAPAHILANDAFVFDPLLLGHLLEQGDAAICRDGVPVLAKVSTAAQSAHIETAMNGEAALDDPSIELIPVDDEFTLYNRKLRKRERPLLMRLAPDTVRAVERATYFGAYKGVTDILTKYLWPEWALVLTRIAASLGMTPNMVTAVGAIGCVAATICFWFGLYWLGMALGLLFMVLDTVDGKLARCTLTSSKMGNIFDHGIDIVHPPFWWWAWAHGLGVWGLALSGPAFAATMIAILGGYLLQRLIEAYFIRRFGFHIHVWQKLDSDFRLITARRNPNMVILFAATLLQRPDFGIIAVAVWTVISLLVHAIRLAQAEAARGRGGALHSWLT